MNDQNKKKNWGNFLKVVELLVSYNKQVNAIVLGNTPQNDKYTSHQIQTKILHVFVINIKSLICHKINDAKSCLIIDKARDESKKE